MAKQVYHSRSPANRLCVGNGREFIQLNPKSERDNFAVFLIIASVARMRNTCVFCKQLRRIDEWDYESD